MISRDSPEAGGIRVKITGCRCNTIKFQPMARLGAVIMSEYTTASYLNADGGRGSFPSRTLKCPGTQTERSFGSLRKLVQSSFVRAPAFVLWVVTIFACGHVCARDLERAKPGFSITPLPYTQRPATKPAPPPQQDQCPPTARVARKLGLEDGMKFRRTNSVATWGVFLQRNKAKYEGCSPFIKRAYLEAARSVMQARVPERFKR
ncbi:MAG: hypothetical protein V2B18_09130 [Pseudomonadota bacterium]